MILCSSALQFVCEGIGGGGKTLVGDSKPFIFFSSREITLFSQSLVLSLLSDLQVTRTLFYDPLQKCFVSLLCCFPFSNIPFLLIASFCMSNGDQAYWEKRSQTWGICFARYQDDTIHMQMCIQSVKYPFLSLKVGYSKLFHFLLI